jgi:hypothetical protein
MYFIKKKNTASSAAPQIPLCRVDAGTESRTVVTLALSIRCSNRTARSNPLKVLWQRIFARPCRKVQFLPSFIDGERAPKAI